MLHRLAFLSRIFRPRATRRTEVDEAYDRREDARTHKMAYGKATDSIGRVTDFESDSEKPRR
jgi:hypothetical protein